MHPELSLVGRARGSAKADRATSLPAPPPFDETPHLFDIWATSKTLNGIWHLSATPSSILNTPSPPLYGGPSFSTTDSSAGFNAELALRHRDL